MTTAATFLTAARPGDAATVAALAVRDPAYAGELRTAADERNRALNHGRVTFIVNRNVNFTNVCAINCLFCGYSVRPGDDRAFLLTTEEVVDRVRASIPLGIREVCITGGLHPSVRLRYLEEMVRALATTFPSVHVHAFSPMEIAWFSAREEIPAREVLARLKGAGLGSMPGTAAEILVDEVRRKICPGKLSTARWIEIVKEAHRLGIPTTATMMFGHVESDRDVAEHLAVLRAIQEETGGFTEFVPLPFMAARTQLRDVPGAAHGQDPGRMLAMHAVARLYFGELIPHIQVSWTKLGVDLARQALHAGVSDMGGTLVEENITRLAGGMHGQYLPRESFVRIIRQEGFEPVARDTLYRGFYPPDA